MSLHEINSRLGLGTVQFGVNYGVTNAQGQVSAQEVAAILDGAERQGVHLLDTASLYGESEAVLGRLLPAQGNWRIVTKTAKFSDLGDSDEACRRLRETFDTSLQNLGRNSVYALMMHEADDLLGPHGPALWREMEHQKNRGRVTKIGASVYTGMQITTLMQNYELDIIQLPYSAVDQRLHRQGVLYNLADKGVEVHARSIFLQGMLLAPPERFNKYFDRLAASVKGLNAAYDALGLSPLEGSVAAVLQRPEITNIIFGVTNLSEFDQVIATVGKAADFADKLDIEPWAIDDDAIVNPANWPKP